MIDHCYAVSGEINSLLLSTNSYPTDYILM